MGRSIFTSILPPDPKSIGRIALVVSRWNEAISRRLLEGAQSALNRLEVPEGSVDVFFVPGSFELPQAAEILARTKKYNAIVPLGCLIQGETLHYEVLAYSVAKGLDSVARTHNVAVSFGVLTVHTLEQGLARSGGRFGNKGEEAVLAAIEMIAFQKGVRAHAEPNAGS